MPYSESILRLSVEDVMFRDLPLNDLIKNSFFYPFSGTDGGVIKDCNLNRQDWGINSFILCDWYVPLTHLNERLNKFTGYDLFASKIFQKRDFELRYGLNFGSNQFYDDCCDINNVSTCVNYVYWLVYKRNDNRLENHGPEKFSILFIGGDSIRTYNSLYSLRRKAPKATAMLQALYETGNGPIVYSDEMSPFYSVINQRGTRIKPQFIYYGGYGEEASSYQLNWGNYAFKENIKNYYTGYTGYVGLWELNEVI